MKTHETVVKDKTSSSERKYTVLVETEWEKDLDSEAEDNSVEQSYEQKQMWSSLDTELKALGADNQEAKHVVKLAQKLYIRRNEFNLPGMTVPSYMDAYKMLNFSRGFGADAYDELIKNSQWR